MDKEYIPIYYELIERTRLEAMGQDHTGPGRSFSYEVIEKYADRLVRQRIIRTRRRDWLIAHIMVAINQYYLGCGYYWNQKTHQDGFIANKLREKGYYDSLRLLAMPKNKIPHHSDHGLVRQAANLWRALAQGRIELTANGRFLVFVNDLARLINPGRSPITRALARAALKKWAPYRRQHHIRRHRPDIYRYKARPAQQQKADGAQGSDEQRIMQGMREHIMKKLRTAGRGLTLKEVAESDFYTTERHKYVAALKTLKDEGNVRWIAEHYHAVDRDKTLSS